MNLIEKFKQWQSGEHPEPVTLKSIWAFIQGSWRANHTSTVHKHIEEQVEYRKSLADPICTKQGYCRVCGCEFPGKLYEDNGCVIGCYPNMMNEEDWKQYQLFIKKNKTN